MNKLIRFFSSVVVFLQFSFQVECKPIRENTNYTANDTDSIKTEIYSFPNPDEIMTYIMDDEFTFNESSLSNPKESYQYHNDVKQNILVGIFLADLAYCFWLDQPAKGMVYLNAIDDLSKNQSLYPHLSSDIKDRLVNNNGNIDSLICLSNDIYKLTKDYLLETERYQSYAFITVGSIIESLYLILNSSNLKYASSTIQHRIAEQHNLISNMENMLNSYLSESVSIDIKKDISPLIDAYNELVTHTAETTISDQNNILIIGNNKKENIDLNCLIKIKKAVEDIRYNWLKH